MSPPLRMFSGILPTDPHGVLMCGGVTGGGVAMNDVWYNSNWYSPADTWTLITSNAEWSPRSHFAMVYLDAHQGSIAIIGGIDAVGTPLNEVWISTNGGNTWVQQSPAPGWSGRAGLSAILDAYAGNTPPLYIAGGYSTKEEGDVWKYTSDGGGGFTSGTVITHAQTGDIYNIGGVSSEPTDAILITAWNNNLYGG